MNNIQLIREQFKRRQWQDILPRLYPEYNHEDILSKNITFVVTENCNLRCTYCYECNKDYHAVMSKETAKAAVDAILDKEKMANYAPYDKYPFVILEFMGGEPLIEIDLIDYILSYFNYRALELNHPWLRHYMINITTNGTLWFESNVQKFLKKYKNILSLSITIDGNKQLHDACRIFPNGHGSYDIVERAVKDAIANYNLRSTKVTLAHDNLPYISSAIPHLFNLGLTDINANVVYENVWQDGDDIIFYNELIKLADWVLDNEIYNTGFISLFDETIGQPKDPNDVTNWCGGNGQMLAIGTDGRMFPCIRYMKYSLKNEREEYEIGDISRGIDTTNKYIEILQNIDRRTQSTDECFYCPVASGCSWCQAFHLDEFGDANHRATYICKMHKARVLANHYYWNKLYKKLNIDDTFQLHLSEGDIKHLCN